MATNDQVSQEYLLVKAFLYKYTPPFTKLERTGSDLSTFSRYSVPLDDTQYFTKYDISSFVTSYSFEQNIDETTYSWSVELMDQVLSYSTINTKLKVLPFESSPLKNGLSFSQNTNSLTLLSQYETNANTFDNNDATVDNSRLPILGAKSNRGLAPGPMTVQGTNPPVVSNIHGLRLSDLIQEYDFVSLFLYKNTTPLTNIWGTFDVDFTLKNNPLWVFTYKTTTDISPVGLKNPLDPYLQNESILLTKMPNGQTLFSNEFNGFVMKKSLTSSINQVDRVTVSGNGWSRLFGSTRRAMKPSLFQNSLYQTGQVLGLADVSALQTNISGRNIAEIIRDLFDQVYRIDFNTEYNNERFITTTLASTNITSLEVASLEQVPSIVTIPTRPLDSVNSVKFFASPTGALDLESSTVISTTGPSTPLLTLTNSFFNITSLIVANEYPANLFNMPQYLLSTVMKFRPFAYIEPLTVPATEDFIDGAINAAAQNAAQQAQAGQQQSIALTAANTNSISVKVSPETFQDAIQNYNTSQQVINYGSRKPVLFEAGVQNLRGYFQYLSDVFTSSFSPELMTPYEILDHIRNTSFVEIFEQPNGQFLIRAPQYNNMATLVTDRPDIALVRSANLSIISSSYNETVENLISKLFANYSPDITPIPSIQKFGYCDGKLLIQNGLMEMETAANPNAATAPLSNNNSNNSKTTGIFGWAEYLMDLSNAKLKTGLITCDLDNTIQVGQTFIDETKFKFGYIVGLSKKVSVTGTAIMSLNLSYVRDGVPQYETDNTIRSINTDLLPVLTNIENSFNVGS